MNAGTEYFKGDAIEDTGAREQHYGATWRVCRFTEGYRKGDTVLRPMDASDTVSDVYNNPSQDWVQDAAEQGREPQSVDQIMAAWAESVATGQVCTCQTLGTDARDCAVHGASLRAAAQDGAQV